MHLVEVIERLDRSRFQAVVVFLVDGRREPLYDRYAATGAEIINLDLPDGLFKPEILQKLWTLSRRLRRSRIDLVHGYLREGNLAAAIVGLLAGIEARVISKRSLERHDRMQLAFAKMGNGLATHITAVSRAVGRFVHESEGASWDKITVIPNGICPGGGEVQEETIESLRQQFAIPSTTVVVGTVARFNWKKGYEYFIKSAAIVVREMPAVRFFAFGDGPLKDQMEDLVDHLGLRNHIVFLGWESDVRSKLPLFDIYVCASVIEGMSNAILEAMAERRAVIATAVGGNPETIRDGATGYLVPAEDPSALAQRILDLARHPERRRTMGEAARESVVRDFSVERMVHQMQDYYSALPGTAADRTRVSR